MTKKYSQISAQLTPENNDWLRDYLYYQQIQSGNPKLTMTDVINEAVAYLKEQRSELDIFPRPDFIRQTERRIRKL